MLARNSGQYRPSHAIAGLLCTALLAVVGCGAGKDAVAQGGTFEFISPGGKTEIFYDPPQSRGKIGLLVGPDLMTEGKTVSLIDYVGKVVVINVWGQWCGPCRGEAAQLEKVYADTKDKGVQFLGIDVRDPQKDKAQDFMIDRKISYPSIWDPSMRSLVAFGSNFPATVVPTTIVLDRQHRVAAVFLKALHADELQPVVERIAAEA